VKVEINGHLFPRSPHLADHFRYGIQMLPEERKIRIERRERPIFLPDLNGFAKTTDTGAKRLFRAARLNLKELLRLNSERRESSYQGMRTLATTHPSTPPQQFQEQKKIQTEWRKSAEGMLWGYPL